MQVKKYKDMSHRNRDKVRVRVGQFKGHKGSIQNISGELFEIALENGSIVQIALSDITNHSLAARKAWETMRNKPINE